MAYFLTSKLPCEVVFVPRLAHPPVLSVVVAVRQASQESSPKGNSGAPEIRANTGGGLGKLTKEASNASSVSSNLSYSLDDPLAIKLLGSERNYSILLGGASGSNSGNSSVATPLQRKRRFLQASSMPRGPSMEQDVKAADSVKVEASVALPNAFLANSISSELRASRTLTGKVAAFIASVPGMIDVATGAILIEDVHVRDSMRAPVLQETTSKPPGSRLPAGTTLQRLRAQTTTPAPQTTVPASQTTVPAPQTTVPAHPSPTLPHRMSVPHPAPVPHPALVEPQVEAASGKEEWSTTPTQRVLYGALGLLCLFGFAPAIAWADCGGRAGWHRVEARGGPHLGRRDATSYHVGAAGLGDETYDRVRPSRSSQPRYAPLYQDDRDDSMVGTGSHQLNRGRTEAQLARSGMERQPRRGRTTDVGTSKKRRPELKNQYTVRLTEAGVE